MLKEFFYIQPLIRLLKTKFMIPQVPINNNVMNEALTQKLIDRNPLVWEKNKFKMLEILKKAPTVGVYKNEDPKNWEGFFKFYVDFLNAEIGPRGQCAKKIRQEMVFQRQRVDEVLKPYNLNHSVHIRSIYVRFKFFIPCQEYHFYLTTCETLQKCEDNLNRLKDPQHPMYVSIKEGMLKKHGADYNYQQNILKLKQNYESKIVKLKEDKLNLQDKLSQMQEYQNWLAMQTVMKKWFDQWVEADSGMGKDSCNRGEMFQAKVLENVVHHIIAKQRNTTFSHINEDQFFEQDYIDEMIRLAKGQTDKKSKTNRLHIFLNSRWNPRSLGEIDITIAEYIEAEQKYEALVLIQCKARLFDLRQASYQVYPQYLLPQQKKQLSSRYGPVYISPKVTSYLVTSLPDFDFALPIESQLKATLDRFSKDKPIESIMQEEMKKTLFEECGKRFNKEESPLEWFVNHDCEKIIVLSRQT